MLTLELPENLSAWKKTSPIQVLKDAAISGAEWKESWIALVP